MNLQDLLAAYSLAPPLEQGRFLALLVTNDKIMGGADAIIAFCERAQISIDDTQGFYTAINSYGESLS